VSVRTLVLDIETSPALVWGYGLWGQNHSINTIEQQPGIIGWSTRWEEEPAKTVQWYDGPVLTGDTSNLPILWEQLHEATHVLHFNGKTFDEPWINHELIKYRIKGGRPYSPFRTVDLMKQVKSRTRNISNKLDYLSRELFDLEGKIAVNAMTQWLKMYHAYQAEDTAAYEKARRDMARYCNQDVNLLPKMKKKYLPWMTGINAGLYNGNPESCPNCGSHRVTRRGYARTTVGNYQRYQCQSCGTWSRGKRAAETTELRNIK
jgi:predicted RNA-binding Zn-ribbon protein involved in translation (DUF1610 family)